ncbi:hypothetical protein EC988_004541 [Linderina pennispora]|nr:hypothetical protein EC988_004541 [Linderina pennispora]
MPLLLSPVHPPQLPQPASAGGAAPMLPDYTPINLAGIRGDVKEGPRRLPSISASLRNDSPPETTCSLGGLGILHTSVSAARSSALPSPMPTPRQTASLGFDGERTSPPHRNNYPDSLSLLATTADRSHGQQRQASVSSRSSMHPYSRSGRRGPSMRSVSLKQSEDIRQLGVLDQSLKLK